MCRSAFGKQFLPDRSMDAQIAVRELRHAEIDGH
jgi:hypothetical protein